MVKCEWDAGLITASQQWGVGGWGGAAAALSLGSRSTELTQHVTDYSNRMISIQEVVTLSLPTAFQYVTDHKITPF